MDELQHKIEELKRAGTSQDELKEWFKEALKEWLSEMMVDFAWWSLKSVAKALFALAFAGTVYMAVIKIKLLTGNNT